MGRTVGLDLGGVRCGVAIDDELGMLAHPRSTLPARDRTALIAALVDFARDEDVERFVLGFPVSLSGHEGPAAGLTRKFAEALARASGKPVELWDERLTSVQAGRALADTGHRGRGAKDRIDAAAAVVLLQSWLDAKRRKKARAKPKPASDPASSDTAPPSEPGRSTTDDEDERG